MTLIHAVISKRVSPVHSSPIYTYEFDLYLHTNKYLMIYQPKLILDLIHYHSHNNDHLGTFRIIRLFMDPIIKANMQTI